MFLLVRDKDVFAPRPAGGDTQTERGHEDAGDSDGTGPVHSADAVADADADLRPEVSHDILMGRIGEVIRDKWVLGLIGKFLRRGPMVDGVVVTSEEGARQFSMKRIYGELGVFRLRGPLREARP